MKKRELAKLRKEKLDDLKKRARELELQITKSKAEFYAGKNNEVKLVSQLRRDRAQILTIIREKEIVNPTKNKARSKKATPRKNKKTQVGKEDEK